jgi:hypothetical protein
MELVLKDGIAITIEDGVITNVIGYEVNNLNEYIEPFVEDAMFKSLYPDLNSMVEMQKIIDGLKREIDFVKANYVSKKDIGSLTNSVLGRL